MQTADDIFEPKKIRARSRGASSGWWLLMLHGTWIILLVIGVWYGYVSWQYASRGDEVPATVIALADHYSSDSGTTYSPVFEYRVGGQTYTYESVNSSDPPTHEVGERTTLLVMPDDPERARENSFWELWLLPVIMCPVAGIVALVSIVLTLFMKPWKREAMD